MRKLILAIVVLIVGAGCNEQKIQEYETGENVQFTVYKLDESLDLRALDDSRRQEGRILMINSDEELADYLNGDHAAIDFSQYTLLLAYGMEPTEGCEPNFVRLYKFTEQSYEMTVNLHQGIQYLPAVSPWQVAILISKMDIAATVELNITRGGIALP